eukprot:GSMAST32.ASY1.ANO1.1997.1 assembled CDS
MRVRNWLFEHFAKVGRAFGFSQYDAPVLEHQELYKRKAGEEITEQMYSFTDKDGKAVTLRPEMTPSLARMVMARQETATGEIKDLLPFKWFCVAQWDDSIMAELELLASICAFFRGLGVGPDIVGIKINSRKFLGSLMKSYGISDEMFAPVCVIIDKLDKIGADAVKEMLIEVGVPSETSDDMLCALEAQSIEELESTVGEMIDDEALSELKLLFTLAESYGFHDYLVFDASVVRGLAYYTGCVWECFDRRGELRAICGGGRYDKLLTLYGSKKVVPCVGFGFGDCVIMELLKDHNLMPSLPRTMIGAAVSIAAKLRSGGATVDLMLQPKKDAKKAFKYADRAGATYCAYVAPDEWSKQCVRIKNMRKGEGEGNAEDKGRDIPFSELQDARAIFEKEEGENKSPFLSCF